MTQSQTEHITPPAPSEDIVKPKSLPLKISHTKKLIDQY